MFSTTTLVAMQMFYVKHWSAIAAIAFLLFFGFLDGEVHYPYLLSITHRLLGLFWGAAVQKIPHVRRIFHVELSPAHPLFVGRVGYSHVGHGPHAFHALLDVG